MDALLTPVSSKYLRPRASEEPFLSQSKPVIKPSVARTAIATVSSADEALEVLKNQPDYDSLIAVLRYLTASHQSEGSFQLQSPSPQSASIIHALVSEIVPNYWTLLRENSVGNDSKEPLTRGDVPLLLSCLRSVSGLNAVTAHLKALIQESKVGNKETKRPDLGLNMKIFLELLASMLAGDSSIHSLWVSSTVKIANASLKRVQSQQLISLLASGRIPSLAAEAFAVIETAGDWVADGAEYSKWIARSLSAWAKSATLKDELAFSFDVFQRSLSLGYAGKSPYAYTLVKTVIDSLLLSRDGSPEAFTKLCFYQPRVVKKVMDILLQHLAQRFLNHLSLEHAESNVTLAAVSGLIDAVVANDEVRRAHLVTWCTSSSGAGLGDGVGIRRAVTACLAQDKDTMSLLSEKSLAQFGDQLYIKHAAMLQQEVHTQILLLAAGHVARLFPIKLNMLLRSSTYLSTISNRIAATQPRTRFLGMVVGEALSALVDNKTKKLDFHMEETEADGAVWLKSLCKVTDRPGPFRSLMGEEAPNLTITPLPSPAEKAKQKPTPRSRPKAAMPPTLPKAIIEEVDSSDDEDLVPYAKASDPEDSDDDATLVQRNKPKAPVYIRDLISYFRDSENYDKQNLALHSAPILIRRKANFGTEVSAHADELAGLLIGLQDKYDIDDFSEKRQQCMIALVVAQPKLMAPWFARTFFEGDYSLAQRTSVLVTLGLSARELAGFDASEHQAAASFPSKRLPDKIEQLYIDSSGQPEPSNSSRLQGLPPTALETISQSLTASFLEPLAAQAADATSGPDILKLETFTERYKSKRPARPRVRAIPNTTAALLATYFFSPLTAHFQFALRSSRPAVLNPALLALYLQTLGIVVNAAGPSTLALPQLTAELWDLLLRVRPHVLGDVAASRGWLVAMTVLVEVNEGGMRRLCEDHGRELVETREWVGGIVERTRGDDGGLENDVKMLAAGVLIKLGEAIEKYQALLMGDLIGFS
ncbi:hypothetical protein HIM_06962 [Hirsutella minnesotensis 3608]|uniref:Telomere length regulation protein conserved domain-containing protein n=1 Tax=Hirsutella minnesotensis 3608 TaxID=1043627 RepID=A0A0F8A4I3_9HYPO|nr:hypothetical protein HIM_06962 [Hirsutella minnesotensis 3608]